MWQEGLLPRIGATARDLDQCKRFDDLVEALKSAQGIDGRAPFVIPSALASRDPDRRAVDSNNLRDWLLKQGFDSPALHWFADYGCRDDYGARAAGTSAWAELLYFACRNGAAADADPHSVLTWPEGNGWLVRQMVTWLTAKGGPRLQGQALCTRVETRRTGAEIDIYLATEQRSLRVHADHVIWAAPAFTLARAWSNPQAGFRDIVSAIETSPWLVANLTLDSAPLDLGPAGLAWDNVLRESEALGYVVATHQTIRVKPGPTILTYYWPLADEAPREARARLMTTPWKVWADRIIDELSKPHPQLRRQLRRIALWRWPHAMSRPVPVFLSLPARDMLAGLAGPLHFAHADLSGLSLFEEANHAGVRAAHAIR